MAFDTKHAHTNTHKLLKLVSTSTIKITKLTLAINTVRNVTLYVFVVYEISCIFLIKKLKITKSYRHTYKPNFHLAHHVTPRHDLTRSTCRAHAFWLCRACLTAWLDTLDRRARLARHVYPIVKATKFTVHA